MEQSSSTKEITDAEFQARISSMFIDSAKRDEMKALAKKLQMLKEALRQERSANQKMEQELKSKRELKSKLEAELLRKDEKNETLGREIKNIKEEILVQRNQKRV